MTILECVVAIALTYIVGVAGLRAVTDAAIAARTSVEADRRATAAGNILASYATLSRQALNDRIGTQREGSFVVIIAHPRPTLFRLGVSEAARPADELVMTVVWRRGDQ